MCSHDHTLKDAEQLLKKFGVTRPGILGKYDMWPRCQGVFMRRPPEHDSGDDAVPNMEAVTGRWGLLSAMTRANGGKAGKQAFHVQRTQRDGPEVLHRQQRLAPGPALHHPCWCHFRAGIAVW